MTSYVETRRDCASKATENVADRAKALVAKHPVLGGRPTVLDFRVEGEVLTIRGAVPSFYLKQVLQSALRELEGVKRVNNQVDVVSSHGLSSVK